jgi:hypothetical protein
VHPTVPFPSQSLLDKTIQVTYSLNGSTSAPAVKLVTFRIFKYLSGDIKTATAIYSGPTQFGYDYNLSYTINTNPGGQVASDARAVSTVEQVTLIQSNISVSPVTGSGLTDANGKVNDQLRLVSSTALNPDTNIIESQNLFVGGIFVRNNTLTFSSSTVTATSNGPFN